MQISYSYTHRDLELIRGYDTLTQRSDISVFTHDRYGIFCFISGEAEYSVDGNVYQLHPGDTVIAGPNSKHGCITLLGKPGEWYALTFSENAVRSLDPHKKLLSPFTSHAVREYGLYLSAEFSRFKPIDILNFMSCTAEDEYRRQIKIFSYFYILLDRILSVFCEKEDTPIEATAERIKVYIDEHIHDELSLPILSEQFFLSVSQINRVFKKAYGLSVGEYILTNRLETSRQLLQNGYSASEACQKSGFKDYSAFYRAYFKRFGNTPKHDMHTNM